MPRPSSYALSLLLQLPDDIYRIVDSHLEQCDRARLLRCCKALRHSRVADDLYYMPTLGSAIDQRFRTFKTAFQSGRYDVGRLRCLTIKATFDLWAEWLGIMANSSSSGASFAYLTTIDLHLVDFADDAAEYRTLDRILLWTHRQAAHVESLTLRGPLLIPPRDVGAFTSLTKLALFADATSPFPVDLPSRTLRTLAERLPHLSDLTFVGYQLGGDELAYLSDIEHFAGLKRLTLHVHLVKQPTHLVFAMMKRLDFLDLDLAPAPDDATDYEALMGTGFGRPWIRTGQTLVWFPDHFRLRTLVVCCHFFDQSNQLAEAFEAGRLARLVDFSYTFDPSLYWQKILQRGLDVDHWRKRMVTSAYRAVDAALAVGFCIVKSDVEEMTWRLQRRLPWNLDQ